MIFVPMHVDADHWTLAVIDVQEKSILLYDPLFSSEHERHVPHLLRWLHEEVCERLGAEVAAEWDAPSWPIVQGNDLPVQKTSRAVGCLCLLWRTALLLGRPPLLRRMTSLCCASVWHFLFTLTTSRPVLMYDT